MEVYLRPITENDTENIVSWRNNPLVRENLYSQDEINAETHLKYYRNMIESRSCYQFIIEVREGIQRTDVGTVFIKNLDKENRKGEFGIFIGEDKFRGKGIGKLSTEKMLEFAFEELKLNKVWLTVFANNIKAIDCYEKAGFVKCAFYSQEILRKNELLDVVGMEILKNRWSKMWKGNPKMYGKGK